MTTYLLNRNLVERVHAVFDALSDDTGLIRLDADLSK
jgi:hypothetical protein